MTWQGKGKLLKFHLFGVIAVDVTLGKTSTVGGVYSRIGLLERRMSWLLQPGKAAW
jgi:hypothetical protein